MSSSAEQRDPRGAELNRIPLLGEQGPFGLKTGAPQARYRKRIPTKVAE